jgi:hypothetical protein
MAASQSNYGKEGVQLRIRDLIMLFYYAFALQCASTIAITRKKPTLEMAARATYLNECVCIHSSAHCVSDSKVISP